MDSGEGARLARQLTASITGRDMTESDRMPRLVVLATGGTIASKKGADGGASPSLTAEDLRPAARTES